MDPFANLEPPDQKQQQQQPQSTAAAAAIKPPPKKRQRTSEPRPPRPPRAAPSLQPPLLSAAPQGPLRDDPTYKLLAAYARSPLIAPKLRQAGISCDTKVLRRLPRARLPLLLDEVEEVLEGDLASDLTDAAIQQGLSCLENLIASRTRFKINGTVEKCFEHERWLFLFERAKLRAGIGMQKLDPLTELTLLTAQMAAITHAQNTAAAFSPPTQINLDAPAPSS